MAKIRFNSSSTRVINRLEELRVRLKNPQPLYKKWAETLYVETTKSIRDEKSPNGKPFAFLSLKYAAYKKRKGGGTRILFWTGKLLAGIRAKVTKNGVELTSTARSKKGELYGYVLHAGRPSQRLPARPFFPFDRYGEPIDRVKKKLRQQFTDFLQGRR